LSINIKEKMHDLKKDLILNEASILFEEVGFEQMKVADLAKTVSVSIGTIYGMFESKEGLYSAYIEHQIDAFTQELKKRATPQHSAEDRLKLFIELKFSYYTQKHIALNQSVKNNPFFFNILYKDNFHPLQNIFLFQAECFKEINKNIDDEEAMQLAYLFNSFSDGYVSRWFETRYDLLSKVDEASRLFSVMVKAYK